MANVSTTIKSTNVSSRLVTFGFPISASSITASLFGTASWSNNATSASYALSASYVTASNIVGTVTSSSYALSASYSTTSSRAISSISSSFATTANTAIGSTVSSYGNDNRFAWSSGTIIFPAGTPVVLTVTSLQEGGSVFVRLNVQVDNFNGTPYTWYGELTFIYDAGGGGGHPGYIRESITNGNWTITPVIVDNGNSGILNQQLSLTSNIGVTAYYNMEVCKFYGNGLP